MYDIITKVFKEKEPYSDPFPFKEDKNTGCWKTTNDYDSYLMSLMCELYSAGIERSKIRLVIGEELSQGTSYTTGFIMLEDDDFAFKLGTDLTITKI